VGGRVADPRARKGKRRSSDAIQSRWWVPPKELTVQHEPVLGSARIDQLDGLIGDPTGSTALLVDVGHLIRECSQDCRVLRGKVSLRYAVVTE
jgi:hypothetical protein